MTINPDGESPQDAVGDEAALAFLVGKEEEAAPAEDEPQDAPEQDEPEPQDAEEEAPAEPEEEPEYEVNGERVKLSELRNGYMKDADYRRKTTEAADAKREAQAIREAVVAERSQYANQLDVLIGGLQAQLIGDQQALAQLAQSDPAEWVRENARFQARYAQYQQAIEQRQALDGRMTAEQERQRADWLRDERTKLHDKLPEWRDTAKATADQRLIGEYLLEAGYSQDELGELFDHRALLVAREAALYRQLKAAKAKQATPTPPQAVKPGPAKPKPEQQRTRLDDLARKARRSYDPDDAVAFLVARQG